MHKKEYTKNELKNVLFNYKRNNKRLEQIRYNYGGIKSLKYDEDKIQTNRVSKQVEDSVVKMLSDTEYIKLTHEIDAVDRVRERLDLRQMIVLDEYFMNRRSTVWIEKNKPTSKGSIYRDTETILWLLEEELNS